MNLTDIPHRFSEAAFRVYEPAISHAVDVSPSDFTIHPRTTFQRSPETVCARLRDAIRSLHMHRWVTSVNMLKFNDIYPRLSVCRDGELVVVRTRATAAYGQTLAPTNISLVEVPLNSLDAELVTKAIDGALLLTAAANASLGACGLGGIKLLGVTADVVTAHATALDLEDRVALVPQGADVILL